MFHKVKSDKAVNCNYPYLKLLSDNSPKANKDYDEDAAILNKQINEPDVFNVAVVAKYGAGKSSVINTYLHNYRNKKNRKEIRNTNNDQLANPSNNRYTRVSLSTFNKNDYDEVAIERSILQQLLYSRKKEKLPNSKIERTNKTSKGKSILFAFLLTVFIISTVLLCVDFSLYGRDINTAGVTSIFGVSWVKFVLLAVSSILLFFITIWILHYRKLKKIKYKDLEADVAQDENTNKSKLITNLINKFIDEVLYFFECINIDLVIFEDLDRLPTTEIFVKLRELNTIINNSAKKAKKVTFLYAVKDELFKTDEERAKFFEFILPVVPVINPNTTISEIENKLKKITEINPKMELTGKFIKGISTFIPDMRILNNTFNDYLIMFHKIFEDDNASRYLKQEKLFALCMYKNLFPYDYALLEKNEGLIPLVININSLQEKCCESINKEITEQKLRITQLQNERLKSFEELKLMFIGQLSQMGTTYGENNSINVNGITTFKNLNFNNLRHPGYKNYNYNVAINSDQQEVLAPDGERFIDRENNLDLIEQNGIEICKNKISDLEKQKSKIFSLKLNDIVKNYGVDFCFSDDLKDKYKTELKINLNENEIIFFKFLSSKYVNKLDDKTVNIVKKAYSDFKSEEYPEEQIDAQIKYLKFLIAKDFIDEHFIEYTSNYKAEILSPHDIKVVQNIQSHQVDFNVLYENLEEVARWLDEDDFNYPAIISKSILDKIHVIKNLSEKEGDNKYKNLINLISDTGNSLIIEMLQDYINISNENYCDRLLKILIPSRPSFCNEVFSIKKLNKEKLKVVLIAFIKYVNYKRISSCEYILNYINKYNDYLSLFDSVKDENKVFDFLKFIKPKFKFLTENNLNNNIQKFIINNNLYELRLSNLETIFEVDESNLQNDFYTKQFETLMTFPNENVKKYIEENIDIYTKKILLNDLITLEKETEENLITLFNNENISVDNRKALISKLKVKFASISDFTVELYNAIFDNEKIMPTWRNILIGYESIGFKGVETFVIANKEILGDFVKVEGIKEETPMKFINSLLKDLKEEEVKQVSKTLPAISPIGGLELKNIDDEILSVFIRSGKSMFNIDDLSKFTNKPKSMCEYIKIHAKQVSDNFDKFFDIVIPNPITQQQRHADNGYYRYKNVVIGYEAKKNTQSIVAYIIGFDLIDISIKELLIQKCFEVINIDGYEEIYANYILSGHAVPSKILWQFSKVNLGKEKKLKILEICDYGGDLKDTGALKDYLISIGDVFSKLFNTKCKVVLEKTEDNKKLLEVLSEEKLISNYKKIKNKNEYSVSA